MRTSHRVGRDSSRATSSAWVSAKVLGRISAKITISRVMITVAAATPTAPGNRAEKTVVVRAEARMLTTLLLSRMAPIMVS